MRTRQTQTPARARRRTTLSLTRLDDRITPSLFAGFSQTNTAPITTLPDAVQTATASSSNGQSVAVWTRVNTGGRRDIFAQVYAADRTKLGSEIAVTTAYMDEYDPSVAMDSTGRWIVSWTVLVGEENRNVRAARFSNTGAPLGAVFSVSAMAYQEAESSVASAGNGDFVVSFTYGTDSTTGIQARRYNSVGTLQGATVVLAPTASVSRFSNVAQNVSGQFAVAYQVAENVFLRRYSATGAVVGVHVIANSPQREATPVVGIANNGNCVVAWEASFESQNYAGLYKPGIRTRTISAAGVMGAPIDVWAGEQIFIEGENVGYHYFRPSIAMDRTDGDFVIVAEYKGYNYGNPGPPSSRTDVYVAEYAASGAARLKTSFNILSFADQGGAESVNIYPAVSIGKNGYYSITYVGYSPSDAPGGTAFVRRKSGRLF